MAIIKTTLPHYSILNNSHKKYNYIDSFQGKVIDKENKLTSIDVGKAFFSSAPKWKDRLFALRNRIASFAGLKTPGNIVDRQKVLDNFKGEKGELVGLFKVFDKTENEMVLGEDDKHLNFRISLFLDNPKVEQR